MVSTGELCHKQAGRSLSSVGRPANQRGRSLATYLCSCSHCLLGFFQRRQPFVRRLDGRNTGSSSNSSSISGTAVRRGIRRPGSLAACLTLSLAGRHRYCSMNLSIDFWARAERQYYYCAVSTSSLPGPFCRWCRCWCFTAQRSNSAVPLDRSSCGIVGCCAGGAPGVTLDFGHD